MALPPDAGPARDQAILARLRASASDPGAMTLRWGTVESQVTGHAGRFHVFADALKIDGTRILVSAALAQTIADELGCMLLTPKLADLLWAQRTVTLRPRPQPATAQMGSTAAMVAQSEWIDGQIASLPDLGTLNLDPVGGGPSAIVQTVGKHWVLTNQLLAHPGRAVNYGWHFEGTFPGADGKPSTWAPCASLAGPGCRVIQGMGWAHDAQHTDYSQNCVLVARACEVDGREMDLAGVLADPELAPLVSHEGPLKILRQPGVPVLSPIPVPPADAPPSGFQRVGVREGAGGGGGKLLWGLGLAAAGLGALTWAAWARRGGHAWGPAPRGAR